MAKTSTGDASSVTMQQLNEAGLNPFAVELLVESYARPGSNPATLPRVTFVWRGVRLTLEIEP